MKRSKFEIIRTYVEIIETYIALGSPKFIVFRCFNFIGVNLLEFFLDTNVMTNFMQKSVSQNANYIANFLLHFKKIITLQSCIKGVKSIEKVFCDNLPTFAIYVHKLPFFVVFSV
jgi:hypothetical protein